MKKHLIKEITRQREIMGLIGEQRVIYTDDSDYGDYLDNCARFKFDSGRSEIDPDGDINFEEIKKSLSVGMETDRPFLKITVSTSGTGGASDNQRVMDARINEAFKFNT